eukprot:scaffold4731_cov36-Tisochrysis_lutea.AAC.1
MQVSGVSQGAKSRAAVFDNLSHLPLLKHTDKHPHFKHITHRRLGTRETDLCPVTRTWTRADLCGRHREDSCHLAWCPATQRIFEAIDTLTGFTHRPERSRTQKTKDRLFVYPAAQRSAYT